VCVDDVLQEACVAGPQDDLVWTQGATCDEVICEEASGACCEAVDGACQNNVLRADCSGSQQTWHKDQSCGAVTCELALGACCDPAVMALRGTCTDDMQRVECLACESGECTWFKRESCAEVAAAKGCIANPIPTVSEWGLVILTLLLLTAAKVYFGYRPQPC
jgi:hypothetical protein